VTPFVVMVPRMGPPFDRHPTTPAQIRGAAASLSRSEGDLDGVMNALEGPAQAAADAVDGQLDGQITVPIATPQSQALDSKVGARLCRGSVKAFADCVELFNAGVDDINERWEHARANDFFVADDVDDHDGAVEDARSEEAAALRREYRRLEEQLDNDAAGLAGILRMPTLSAIGSLERFQNAVDIRTTNMGKPEYVALGDSYSAGTGAGDYKPHSGDTNPYRSANAYPELLADRLGLNLDHRAVNGATTDGIQDQLTTLGPDTEYVTITAGGNNVGFGEAVTDSVTGDGTAAIENSRDQIENELPEDLDALYSEIRERAPNATVVVGTYPQLVDGRPGGQVSVDEEKAMNEAADDLADVIQEQADEHGFDVADVRDRFDGHEADAYSHYYYDRGTQLHDRDQPWINEIDVRWRNLFNDERFVESYHPNADGHEGYADEFEKHMD